MSLPETIWWCEVNRQDDTELFCRKNHDEKCGPRVLAPFGSRIAGPDDLVIRRDMDGNWPTRVLAEINVELEARRLTGLDEWSVQSIVELALAAVEGEE